MIKSLLKIVFPRPVLKNAFLVLNKIKIRTIDRIFFPPLKLDPKDFMIYREVNPFLLMNVDQSTFSTDVRERLKIWTDPKWSQDEYLLVFAGGGYIDPSVGWAVTRDNKLVYPSLGFSHAPHVHKPLLSEMFLFRKKKLKLTSIISLRDTGEENYFHFFNDIIAKLYFIRDAGFDLKEFTIVISRKLEEKEYFRVIKEKSWLKGLRYFVQGDEWIEFDKAVFCKPLTHTVRYFQETSRFLLAKTLGVGNRRVFITRDSKTLRFIENMEDLQPVLENYGFEIIDSAKLPFLEQVSLFSECRMLIGVHGAGLTNMIFRDGQQLSVLEIAHPFEYIPFHYIMLSNQYHYQYHVILGKKGNSKHGGFRVEPAELEGTIKKLL
jgi:hypothetical protein